MLLWKKTILGKEDKVPTAEAAWLPQRVSLPKRDLMWLGRVENTGV